MNTVIAQPARDFLNLGFKLDHLLPQASVSKVLPTARSNLGPFVTWNHTNIPRERFISLKCQSCSRLKGPFVVGPKKKLLKLSAFKSNNKNDELRSGPTGSKSLKNSVGLSYIPQDSQAAQASLAESAKAQSIPTSESESMSGSVSIQNLFKSWLLLLRTPSPDQPVDQTVERSSVTETSETQSSPKQKERNHILKVVWCFLWNLDATISIPLMIFIPSYLAVNIKYGAAVSRELAPLWVLGPFIAALYVKMSQGIGALYVFSFKQTVNVIRNLPTYLVVAYDYIFKGKLIELVRVHLLQPLIDIKNMDYKEEFMRRMKRLQLHYKEKYLDFVESIWPYYCRTIRFLKRANLI